MTAPTPGHDGRSPLRRRGGAPKPVRFDELVQAHIDGDTHLVLEIEHEIREGNDQ